MAEEEKDKKTLFETMPTSRYPMTLKQSTTGTRQTWVQQATQGASLPRAHFTLTLYPYFKFMYMQHCSKSLPCARMHSRVMVTSLYKYDEKLPV